MGTGMLSSAASAATESWLAAHHITSAVSLNIADGGLRGGSLDMLVPFYNAGKNLVFTQFGMRRANSYTVDYRNTFNMGVGYRHETNGWLLGVNSFLDRDAQGDHDRLSMGVEAWTDFLKVSANSYKRLSNWKNSPDRADYQERPAAGWDVRAEGYLPAYPQLGGQIIFEKYYGDEVSLFSANDRQKNPHAMTLGAIYNPVPLLSLGVNHRIGQDGLADSSANLTFNYRLGESFAKQVSSSSLIASRLVTNARYDLVARNNEIVLDNRKKALELKLPAAVSGKGNETVLFTVTGASNFASLSWVGPAASFAGPPSIDGTASLTLPEHIDGGVNTYTLQAMGMDRSGRSQLSNVMTVNVLTTVLQIDAAPATIVADGFSTTTLSAYPVDSLGKGTRTAQTVTWTTSAGTLASDTSDTDSRGVARMVLTSPTSAGLAKIEAQMGTVKGSTSVRFAAGLPSADSSALLLEATPLSITADGVSSSSLTATIYDDLGNPVDAGHAVNWETTSGQLADTASLTDATGVARMKLTSSIKTGVAQVQASIGAAKQRVPVSFVPGIPATGNRGLALSATPTTIKSDGISTSALSALISDDKGNPVEAGVTVNWSASAGSLTGDVSYTDTDGVATMTLTSEALPGAAKVKASAGASNNELTVTFAPGVPAAGSAGLVLLASPDLITADGVSTSVLTATVLDNQGDPVGAGMQVDWSASIGTLTSEATSTDVNGVATVSLISSTIAGKATVDASAGVASNAVDVTFAAGLPAAGKSGLAISAAPSVIEADGISTSALTAVVKDAHGNTVDAGVNVTWTTSAGSVTPSNAVTDATGKATAVLTSTASVETATVQAEAGAAQNSADILFVLGAATITSATLNLAASQSSLLADGASTSSLTATVKDIKGQPVGAGIPVNWTTSAGQLNVTVSTTDSNGQANAVLTSSTVSGSADVQAVSGAAHDQLDITFAPGVPAAGADGLTITATPAVIPADGGSTTMLSAQVRDRFDNPVAPGTPVTWTVSRGLLASAVTATDFHGVARVQLTSGTTPGAANIGASANAANNHASVTFSTPAPTHIAVTPAAASINGDGASNTVLSAALTDVRGMPLGAGVLVEWSTSVGTLMSDESMTNANGVASTILTSTPGAHVALVEAKVGAVQGSAKVVFTVGAPAALTLSASHTSIVADSNSKSTLSAQVWDADLQPVGAGIVVYWTTTAGTLGDRSSTTDVSGVAVMELTSASELVTAAVYATAQSATNLTHVRFTGGVTAKLQLTPTPTVIDGDGKSTSLLSVAATDISGNPVVGAVVRWTTSAGTLVNDVSTTNALGIATMTLTSSKTAAVAKVVATVDKITGSAEVTFAPLVNSVTVSVSNAAIIADGYTRSTISASVVNNQGKPVGAGVAVQWTSSAGTLSDRTSLTDAAGIAKTELTSSTAVSKAAIEASAGSVKGSGSVAFTGGRLTFGQLPNFGAALRGQVTFNAVVTDDQGRPVQGVKVYWKSTFDNRFGGNWANSSVADIHFLPAQPFSVTDSAGNAQMTFAANLQHYWAQSYTVSAGIGSGLRSIVETAYFAVFNPY